MNEILKENYNQNYLLYDIIEKMPKYIILNEQLIKLITDQYTKYNEKSFTINSLFSIFEYFEDLCWEEIQKNIPQDYMLDLPKDIKKVIFNYFNTISLEKKIITRINLSEALRKLISRSIAGTRQETDIKSDLELKLYISREDLWSQEILNNDLFVEEIDKIFGKEILVGHCYCMYKLIKNNDINLDDIFKEEKNEEKEENKEKKEEDKNKNLEEELNEEDDLISKEKENKILDESEFSQKEFLKMGNDDAKNNEESEEEEMDLWGKNRNNLNEIKLGANNKTSERIKLLDNNGTKEEIEPNGQGNKVNEVSLYGFQALQSSEIPIKKPNKNTRRNNNLVKRKKCPGKCDCDDYCSIF